MPRGKYCQICHKLVDENTLSLMRTVRDVPEGQNLFAYSRVLYDATSPSWWDVSPSSGFLGYGAMGVEGPGDVHVADDGSATVRDATAELQPGCLVKSSAVDVSSAEGVVFSFYIGWERETTRTKAVTTQVWPESGAVLLERVVQASNGWRTFAKFTTAELSAAGADLSALRFAVQLPSSGTAYWLGGMQLETDKDGPGRLVWTNGSAKTYTKPTTVTLVLRVCPECRTRMNHRVGQPLRKPRRPTIYTPSVEID